MDGCLCPVGPVLSRRSRATTPDRCARAGSAEVLPQPPRRPVAAAGRSTHAGGLLPRRSWKRWTAGLRLVGGRTDPRVSPSGPREVEARPIGESAFGLELQIAWHPRCRMTAGEPSKSRKQGSRAAGIGVAVVTVMAAVVSVSGCGSGASRDPKLRQSARARCQRQEFSGAGTSAGSGAGCLHRSTGGNAILVVETEPPGAEVTIARRCSCRAPHPCSCAMCWPGRPLGNAATPALRQP